MSRNSQNGCVPLLKSGVTGIDGQHRQSTIVHQATGSVETMQRQRVGHSSSFVMATAFSRKRLCMPKYAPTSKFSDREKDFYRYNVFYNRMADQVRADPVLLPQASSKGIVNRSRLYQRASDVVTSARHLMCRSPSTLGPLVFPTNQEKTFREGGA